MTDRLKDIFTRVKSADDAVLHTLLATYCSRYYEYYSIEGRYVTLDSMFALQKLMREPLKTSYINKLCLVTATSEEDRDWALTNASARERVQAFLIAIELANT